MRRIVPLLLLTGCGVWPRPPAVAVDPPAVPPGAAFAPTFETTAGTATAGTAFAVTLDGRSLVLTARFLLGRRGGLSRDLPPAEWPTAVRRVRLADRFTGAAVGDARPIDAGPVLALVPAAGVRVTGWKLADDLPSEGARVWLIAKLDGLTRPAHRAQVVSPPDANELEYRFAGGPNLSGADGAAVLDDDGRVLGLHVGSDDVAGHRHGFAVPAWQISRAIETVR